MATSELFLRFQQRLTVVGGQAHFVESIELAADSISAHPALAGREIVVPPLFDQRTLGGAILPLLRAKGIVIVEAGDPAGVADAPAGLTDAEMAIAETGSVVLAENSLEARIVSMLTLTHFVLVPEDKLVPMLDDAGRLLQHLTQASANFRHYISFVTGPSRTADIERTLTIGVQGPKEFCVIVVKGFSELRKRT